MGKVTIILILCGGWKFGGFSEDQASKNAKTAVVESPAPAARSSPPAPAIPVLTAPTPTAPEPATPTRSPFALDQPSDDAPAAPAARAAPAAPTAPVWVLKDREGKSWKDSDPEVLKSFVRRRNVAIEETCLRRLLRSRSSAAVAALPIATYSAIAPATFSAIAPATTIYSTYVPQSVQTYSSLPVIQDLPPVQYQLPASYQSLPMMIAPSIPYQAPVPQRVYASPQGLASPQASATGLSLPPMISYGSCSGGSCPQ